MIATDQLLVRVNEDLVLDAGTSEQVSGPAGPERLIRPPETTLFHQVLAYLRAKPDPPGSPSGSMVGREGVAATALVLRWGSYLAVLLDRDKPLWSAVRSPEVSRISDEEMARINIEASAALAEWIDLYRADPGGSIYTQLVNRAVFYLPMPKKTSKLVATDLAALAEPTLAARLVQATDVTRRERVRADAERFPSRTLPEPHAFQHPGEHGLAQRARGGHPRRTLPGLPTRATAGEASGRADADALYRQPDGIGDDAMPAARNGATSATVDRAGVALRPGRADRSFALDAHRGLARGAPDNIHRVRIEVVPGPS